MQHAKLYSKELKLINNVKNDYFFVAKNGGVIQYAAYSKFIRHASETSLKRRIKVHALRHTHASLLLAEGISIDTISRRLGHEDSRITKEIRRRKRYQSFNFQQHTAILFHPGVRGRRGERSQPHQGEGTFQKHARGRGDRRV